MLDNPDATNEDLMKIVLGPDFPTGAQILGRSGIYDAYTTGRGSIKLRAVAEIEETARGDTRIVVSQLPYQTSVEVIGQKIAELVNDRRIEGIRDVRNASAGDTTLLVIELKRDANAQVVLNQLYKHTPMQTSFPVHMLALVDGIPRLLDLQAAIKHYVDHQRDVVRRRTEYRLRRAQERAHIVEGLVKALDMIEAVIALIRGAADVDTARTGLMAAPFEFSEVQANYILDMQLRRLTQLEGQKLREELGELEATIKELESILASDTKLNTVIKDELAEVRKTYADARKTRDHHRHRRFRHARPHRRRRGRRRALAPRLREDGRRRRVPPARSRRSRCARRQPARRGLRRAPAHHHRALVPVCSSPTAAASTGLRAHEIPMKERTARGTAIVNLIALGPDEHIEAVIDTRTYEDGAYLFFATRNGMVKKTRMSEYDSSLRTGLIAINLNDGDELVKVVQTSGNDDILMVSRNGMSIRFTENDVRSMGRATAGVRGHEAEERRGRGRELRRREGRHGDAVRELERPREAHPPRPFPPPGPWRPGRTRYEDHRFQGFCGGRVHCGARR